MQPLAIRRSIDYFLEEEALKESALYAKQFIKEAVFISRDEQILIWKTACQESKAKGLHLEFGVHTGISLNCLARMKPRVIWYGFDSFLGLQENWRGGFYPKHFFSLKGIPPQVESNVQLVKGWFNQTLRSFFTKHKGVVSIANIDCDTYEASRCVFTHLSSHLTKGSVLLLDDYLSYVGWKEGMFKAWKECVKYNNLKYQYIAFCGSTALIKII